MRRLRHLLAAVAAIAAVAAVTAAPAVAGRLTLGPNGCSGAPIHATKVIQGTFGQELRGSYVMVPFDVPRGTTAVRVKYCWADPPNLTGSNRSTLDLGLWSAQHGSRPWGTREFRGWGGSSHGDTQITPQGFSSEAEYLADPSGNVPGRTTRGFVPGRIGAGRWAVELGVAYVTGPEDGNPLGEIPWRVEIELSSDPANARDPYRPARFDTRPANPRPGWYAGDMHVHAEHSALGDATMSEVFGYAFKPISEGGAGLDFVTLTDYVTTSAWGEIGRYQARYPGKQIMRSAEVITYHGHFTNQGSLTYVDHRTGPVYERAEAGSLTRLRGPTPPADRFRTIHRHGGVTQVAHPRIFYPSSTPGFASFCRGCPWEYTDEQTNWRDVDAFEVSTGPPSFGDAPSPFLLQAVALYDRLTTSGYRIAAVGVSDSHKAGRSDATSRPVGTATTVIRARRLSEGGIKQAVRAGHTYLKLFGNAGPDLRLSGRATRSGPGASASWWRGRRAIMGDRIRAPRARLRVGVLGGDRPAAPGTAQRVLLVMRNGAETARYPVGSATLDRTLDVGPGVYRLQLQRGPLIEAVSSPIWVGPRSGWTLAASATRRRSLPSVPAAVLRRAAAGGFLCSLA